MIGGPLSLQQCVSAADERHASFQARLASVSRLSLLATCSSAEGFAVFTWSRLDELRAVQKFLPYSFCCVPHSVKLIN